MKSNTRAAIVIAASYFPTEIMARTWHEIVNPLLYRHPGFDANRVLFIQEQDPFDFGPSVPTVEPSPTAKPSASPIAAKDSFAPTLPPTPAPSTRADFVSGNGGCQAHETLYQVMLVDLWGDGWGNSKLDITRMVDPGENPGETVVQQGVDDPGSTEFSEVTTTGQTSFEDYSVPKRVFSSSLNDGTRGYEYVCLEPDRCYEASVGSSEFDYEIKWEIRKVSFGLAREDWEEPLTRGLAPDVCHFSVAASTSDFACPNTCGQRRPHGSNYAGKAPTPAPVRAQPFTSFPSDAPSLVPSVNMAEQDNVPSDAPSFVPTNPGRL